MSRSLRVHQKYVNLVKSALPRNGYPRQQDLAEELNISLSTVNNFLNGKPIDNLNFTEICHCLGLEKEEIADFADLENKSYQAENTNDSKQPVSDFYVERVIYESQCYEVLLKLGALLRLKAPQQMGKTLLMERVIAQLRAQGYQTLTLSFELADSTVFSDLRQFSRWFCATVARHLTLPNQLDDYWDDIFGCNTNTTAYFQDYLLPAIDKDFVLVLDKVDVVFEHPTIANDFCRLLRGWYDMARRGNRNSKIWEKLRLVVVHSTEVYSSLDIHHSPLGGIGSIVELPELTQTELQDLAHFHGLDWDGTQVEQLMAMVGGHPYLLQLAFHYIKQEIPLEQILLTSATEAGIYSDHLRRHLGNLQQNPQLMTAFKEVVESPSWVTIEANELFKLYSMGLVKLSGNQVMQSCDLYRQYFSQRI